MAIKRTDKNNDSMSLDFTNGDIVKFDEVMKKYNFLSEEAFIRYVVSILLVNEAQEVMIKKGGAFIPVVPVEVKREGENATK